MLDRRFSDTIKYLPTTNNEKERRGIHIHGASVKPIGSVRTPHQLTAIAAITHLHPPFCIVIRSRADWMRLQLYYVEADVCGLSTNQTLRAWPLDMLSPRLS